jgi:membrane protein YdbS with pleckstrin-like domain
MLEAWIRLARKWLKLPPGNPAIPAGDPASVQTWNPAEGYLRYQLLGFWISSIPLGLLGLGGFAGAGLLFLLRPETQMPAGLLYTLAVGSVLLGCLFCGIVAFRYATVHLELDMLRYTLTDRAIRLRRGVIRVDEVTLSYANIQNVKYVQGPLQRYFGIGDLIVETAGGGMAASPQQAGASLHHQGLIKGIGEPERLRDLILERVRKVRGAGLGDVGDPKVRRQPGSLDSPEGRALLAEIRDGLAAINRAG